MTLGKLVVRFLLGGVGLFCAGLLALVLYYGTYFTHPEWLGAHPAFYRACKGIPRGATLEQARRAMRPFLEVGKGWAPAGMPAGIFDAGVQGLAESGAEHTTRLLFIPDARNSADWCLVYPQNGRVARIEIAPD